MTPKPHDVVDLRLAPVALQVDQRLEELGHLSAADLGFRVELDNNRPTKTAEEREVDLLSTITRLIDLGGWEASWSERGVRLSHGHHGLVLGVPTTLRDYVQSGLSSSAAVSS